MRKICLCGGVLIAMVGSYGVYFCEKCGYEVHYDEPTKTVSYGPGAQTNTVTSSGVGTSSLPSTSIR